MFIWIEESNLGLKVFEMLEAHSIPELLSVIEVEQYRTKQLYVPRVPHMVTEAGAVTLSVTKVQSPQCASMAFVSECRLSLSSAFSGPILVCYTGVCEKEEVCSDQN